MSIDAVKCDKRPGKKITPHAWTDYNLSAFANKLDTLKMVL